MGFNSGFKGLNFLFVVQQPKAGLGRLITEVSSPAGLLWATDQFVTRAATYATHNKPKRWRSMSSTGFEPAILAIKRM